MALAALIDEQDLLAVLERKPVVHLDSGLGRMRSVVDARKAGAAGTL